jgi:hypothetical protein
MDRLLTLLQETDRLLHRTESNLAEAQKVGEMPLTTVEDINGKLASLLQRHKDAGRILLEKKEKVLKALVEISLLFGDHTYHQVRDDMRDILVSQKSNGVLILFGAGSLLYYQRAYTISKLSRAVDPFGVGNRDDHPFYRLCYQIIEEIPELVGQMSQQATVQAQETPRLRRLLTDIAKMEMPRV